MLSDPRVRAAAEMIGELNLNLDQWRVRRCETACAAQD